MPVNTTKPAMNLRDLLAKLAGVRNPPRVYTHWFSGTPGQVSFLLPAGWRVRDVYVAGLLFRPGTLEDYTIVRGTTSGTVLFAFAPGVVDVGIQAESQL